MGLLSEGIHPATWDEVRATFGSGNDTRVALYAGLREFVNLAETFGLFTSIIIDGSFVTNKAAPADVDAVLILPAQGLRILVRRPDYNRLDNAEVKEKYGVDLYIEDDHAGMVDFFQRLKIADALGRGVGPRYRRGVLEVML